MTYTFEELIEEKLSNFEKATGVFLKANRELVKKELIVMCKNVKALTIRECDAAIDEADNNFYFESFSDVINENTIEI